MTESDRTLARVEARLQRVEEKLDQLLQKFGGAPRGREEDEDMLAEVRELLRKNLKINAIKRYREITGCGLAEAKNAVEAME